jgi:uncharacterized membrane protein
MDPMTQDSPKPSLWRRIALPISIILNLFLVALIVGYVLYGQGASGVRFAFALANAETILPPKDAGAFRTVVRRDEANFIDARKQLREARQELVRQIGSDQFDQAATRQALANLMTSWNHFMDEFSPTLIEALSQVSPDGRRKLLAVRPDVAGPHAP